MKRRSLFHRHAHPYAGDGIADVHGADRCRHCGLARAHSIHTMPPVDADVAAVEARRLGELPDRQDQADAVMSGLDELAARRARHQPAPPPTRF